MAPSKGKGKGSAPPIKSLYSLETQSLPKRKREEEIETDKRDDRINELLEARETARKGNRPKTHTRLSKPSDDVESADEAFLQRASKRIKVSSDYLFLFL